MCVCVSEGHLIYSGVVMLTDRDKQRWGLLLPGGGGGGPPSLLSPLFPALSAVIFSIIPLSCVSP